MTVLGRDSAVPGAPKRCATEDVPYDSRIAGLRVGENV